MRHRALHLRAAALTVAVMVVGCTSSDGETDDITSGTVDAAATSQPSNSGESDAVDDPSTATAPPVDDSAATNDDEPAESEPAPAPTTTLQPSAGADLPTQAPGATVPVTTLAGPLPDLDVRLIELGTYDRPVDATSDDGDRRLFIVQKGGTIVAADDESDTVVLDISTVDAASFTDDGGEQGLLGLAFHPDDDLAYVDFTDGDGNTVVAEFGFDPVSYQFDPSSYREVLTVDQPFENHNGGDLEFGPDGLLYVSLGDGGSADDPNRSALDMSTRLGKILRIDPTATDDAPFSVPADNPFVDTDGADPTIWARGLRNPWRFSFDTATGDLWIADVGQGRFEEVDLAPATDGRGAGKGLSFGWSAFEANEAFNTDQGPDGHLAPVTAYPHENGNCAVSGGVVARNSSYTDLNGWYVYGDFCSGRLWALDTTSVTVGPDGPTGSPRIVEIGTVPALVSVTVGPFGDLYAISNTGQLFRLAKA